MKIKKNADLDRLKAIANQKQSISPPSSGKKKFIHKDDSYNLKVKKGNAKVKQSVSDRIVGKKNNVATEEEYKRIALKEIELMTRMAEYKKANKIEFFDTPNPKQALVLEAWRDEKNKVFTFTGGNRSGKTTLGTILAISTMLGYYPWSKEPLYFPHDLPRKIRYIGQDWSKQIKSVIIPELFKWMPKNRKITRKKNNDGIEVLWTDEETGSSIEVMSNLQDSGLHEGWSGDLIVYDEPPKRPIRVANARGLVDRLGRELFCMTLLKEAWVDREIIKAVDENGRPDMSVFNIHVESFENVGFGITKEGLDQFSKALTPEERKIRLNGVPAYMDGLVYPQYDRKIHLVERFQIPLDWIVDIAIDIHPRTEQAILFCAVSPTGTKYLINEIWEHGDGKWVGEQIVRCIKQNNYRIGRIIIDPLSKGDSNNPNTVFEKVSLILSQYGYYLETATKDKTAGILEIKDHLKGANNMPSLFIFNDLVRTIFEIEGYVYDKETQKPIDKDDHMCENLYRIMLLNTQFIDLSESNGLENQKDSLFSNNGRDLIGGY